MKRDRSVLQFILEQIEESESNSMVVWSDQVPDGHSFKSLHHHAALLKDAALVQSVSVEHNVGRGRVHTSKDLDKSLLRVSGITLEGYDYLDELRE